MERIRKVIKDRGAEIVLGILLISGITGILTEVITHLEVINKRIVIGGNNSSVDATPQSQQFYFPGW